MSKEYPFAARLNSQVRQASADRAWFAISRFYENCKTKKPGKKGYPAFQHNNPSVEYKATGWKLEPDGRHLRFTDGCGIGRLRLVGNPGQHIETLTTTIRPWVGRMWWGMRGELTYSQTEPPGIYERCQAAPSLSPTLFGSAEGASPCEPLDAS